ncbi:MULTISPECIES: nuclear transport factor 2 family protein [Amycolatopsis]|uniref:Nuclear transport factor 2 family protein n=1 Tax=Amycolatopsis dendrobii TaxID=2760662 RepID=A0A7W3VS14_9PSEU|nr:MULTISPECIES: nuclear transport factor 2 family protein [Amycolatopsis]MBB1152014.1 nuclear transport factor 2 family protein [Amycolatopsis dendrobii]UKD57780.1 nuclear transport factor 2 family protein [Amycolatopsis sp. FU40]
MQDHELDALLATSRIIRTFNSYYRAVDEQQFDAARFRRVFAPDGKIVRPNGAEISGPADIADSHARSFARFEASQHLLTGHDVDLDGAAAEVRANLVAIHLWKDRPVTVRMEDRAFTAGGVVTAGLSQTGDGWRIAEVRTRILWRTGYFGDLAPTR